MVDVTVDVKVDGKVVKKDLAVGRKGEEDPFSSGSIGYHVNDTIDIEGKGHMLNFLLVQKGTKGKYSN